MFAIIRINEKTGDITHSAIFDGEREIFPKEFIPFRVFEYNITLEEDVDITESDGHSIHELSHEELEKLIKENARIEKLDAEELRKEIKVFKKGKGHTIEIRKNKATINKRGEIIEEVQS
jgi:hypothetical protein